MLPFYRWLTKELEEFVEEGVVWLLHVRHHVSPGQQ
jgi:hypothetical protein